MDNFALMPWRGELPFTVPGWTFALDLRFARWLAELELEDKGVNHVRRRQDFLCFMVFEGENYAGEAFWYEGFDAAQHRDAVTFEREPVLGDLAFNKPLPVRLALTDAARLTLLRLNLIPALEHLRAA